MTLGAPRVHYRVVDSTNARARELAERGAPHGTLVTAAEQTAGRGRQGRSWSAPPGQALLCSLLLRDPPNLLPLATGVAVAGLIGEQATLKWPNDVLLDGRKVAGILAEGRPGEGWAVVGIGINVAMRDADFSPELSGKAAGLGLSPSEIEPTLARLLKELASWVSARDEEVLSAVRARDALLGRQVRWGGGQGKAAGVDERGRLLVRSGGDQLALQAGEVHLA